MRQLFSLFRSSFIGNQAGNGSVGYLMLAAVVGLAGITSLGGFGDASNIAIADKAASASAPQVGAKFSANSVEGEELAPGPELGQQSSAGSSTAGHGSDLGSGIRNGLSAVVAGFGAKALLGASLSGAAAALAPWAAGALIGVSATLGLGTWHDLHPSSFHAVTNWINDSFIGNTTRAVRGALFGDNWFGNTVGRAVRTGWNTVAAVARGGVTGVAAAAESVWGLAKTLGYGLYDITQLDKAMGHFGIGNGEFNDYAGLWNYPVTSLYWNATKASASRAWNALLGRRPIASAIAKTSGAKLSSNWNDKDASPDASWPYDMQIGDKTADFEDALTQIGIDKDLARIDSATMVSFDDGNGGSDEVVLSISGSDAEGYVVLAGLQSSDSDQPETLFHFQATAEELDQVKDNLFFYAVDEAGLDMNDFQNISSQTSYDQIDEGKKQTFAMLTMDGADVTVQGAEVDLESFSDNAVPMTNSYWRFSMVDDEVAVDPETGEEIGVFELVEAEASTEVVEVSPQTQSATPSAQAPAGVQ